MQTKVGEAILSGAFGGHKKLHIQNESALANKVESQPKAVATSICDIDTPSIPVDTQNVASMAAALLKIPDKSEEASLPSQDSVQELRYCSTCSTKRPLSEFTSGALLSLSVSKMLSI